MLNLTDLSHLPSALDNQFSALVEMYLGKQIDSTLMRTYHIARTVDSQDAAPIRYRYDSSHRGCPEEWSPDLLWQALLRPRDH